MIIVKCSYVKHYFVKTACIMLFYVVLSLQKHWQEKTNRYKLSRFTGKNKMTFAERLRYYREKADLSQKELCEKIDISFSTYNNYETRGYEPKIDILIKLAAALNIDVNALVGYQVNDKETLLNILRAAGILFEMDPDDNNALFVENEGLADGLANHDKAFCLKELGAHLTFDDVKKIIDDTQKETERLATPIFYRAFQHNLYKFKVNSPYDPKDRMVWPAGWEQYKEDNPGIVKTLEEHHATSWPDQAGTLAAMDDTPPDNSGDK